MLKFFSRFLIGFVLIILFVSVGGYTFYSLVIHYGNNTNDTLRTGGIFHFVQTQLAKVPPSDWQQTLKQLTPQKSHTSLNIIPIDSLSLTKGQKQRLLAGKITAYPLPNRGWYTLQRIGQSDDMLQMVWIADEKTGTRWFFHSLFYQLRQTPQDQWNVLLKNLSQYYHMPLAALPIDQLPLNATQRQTLRKNQFLYTSSQYLTNVFAYAPIPNSNLYLKIGPATGPFFFRYAFYFLIVACIILFVILTAVWTYPFYRNMAKLSWLANRFSQGDFHADVAVNKLSSLHHHYRTLKTMGNAIDKLIQSHKELTDAVSHELRTPLSRIRFATEMSTDQTRAKDYLDEINHSVDELNELVEELLTYARYDRQQAIEMQPHNVTRWLQDVVKNEKPLVRDKLLKLEMAKDIGPATFNAKLLTRALHNLISNALRYAKSTVLVTAKQEKAKLLLTVEDDGPGIPKADRDKIFEPFQRLDDSRTRETGGYGLGLAIVKNIVKQHRAEITIGQSTTLGGAKFSIALDTKAPHH